MERFVGGVAMGVLLTSLAFVLFVLAEGARWCRR